MNIAFLNTAPGLNWGGGEKWTITAAHCLSEKGHKVIVIGRTGSLFLKRAAETGVDNLAVKVGMDYSPHTILQLAGILKKNRIDVLVVHFNKDVRTGGVAAKMLGIKVVHRNGFPVVHNNMRHRITQRFVDRILTNSCKIKNQYLSYGWFDPETFDVVPNGISLPEQPPPGQMIWHRWLKHSENDLIAVFAGRLTAVKRVDDLIEVWKKLPRTSRWKLVIMGYGNLMDHLNKRIADENLTDRIALTGFQTNAGYLSGAADIVLLPSADEGMPNALMEAMSQGVPVAASPVGDTEYLLEHGEAGWLIPVGRIDGYVELLQFLENHRPDLRTMGMRGFERIKSKFSLEKMIEGIERSLTHALESKS